MMQKWILTFMFLLPGFIDTATAQTSYAERVHQYVITHRDMAIEEQRRSGVPAAIKLGQGILETAAGESRLCAGANNHFGIKCKRGWEGETFAHTDDAPDECFRKYSCVQDSYTDHSDFLSNSKRYAPLFQLKPTDYKGWAHGLKKCGYATNPRYAQQLIKIIEEYKLHEYTQLALRPGSVPVAYASLEVVPEYDRLPPDTPLLADASSPAVPAKGVQTVNGLKAFYARKGDVLLDAAIRHKIHYPKLLEINDLPDAPLEADMFIYLERKNTKGKHQRYIVQQGESLIQIAQAEGLQLKQLRAYNMLEAGEEPQPGAVLYLQQPAPGKPPVTAGGAVNRAGAVDAVQQPVVSPEYIILKKENEKKTTVTANAVQHTTTVQASASRLAQTPAAVSVQQQPVAAVQAAPAVRPVHHQDDTDTPLPGTPVPVQTSVNIAAEPAIEELLSGAETQETQAPAVVAEEEPQDALARLKAKMDKVVYSTTGDPQVRQTKSGIKVEEELQSVATEATVTPPAVTPAAAPDKYHIVKKGETAFGISKKYNITMKQLREWNNLEFEAIRIDQKLRVKP